MARYFRPRDGIGSGELGREAWNQALEISRYFHQRAEEFLVAQYLHPSRQVTKSQKLHCGAQHRSGGTFGGMEQNPFVDQVAGLENTAHL